MDGWNFLLDINKSDFEGGGVVQRGDRCGEIAI